MLKIRSSDITQLKYLINFSFVANFLKYLPTNVQKVMLLKETKNCLLYTSPSPRDRTRDRMPSSD